MDDHYDVAVIGGGLAGLAVSILLNRAGHKVLLVEKEHYPFHKVCGEYISNESRGFLSQLGIDIDSLEASNITKLQVSSTHGRLLEQQLPLGGFGISRYLLDDRLATIARAEGVVIAEGIKVNDVIFIDDQFILDTSLKQVRSRVACCSYGKRSNIDIRWKRPFAEATKSKLNNYVAIKYHIETDFDPNTVALHNFHQGYCGVVKVEGDKYCLCYMTTANNLQKHKGSIEAMERNILSKNPHIEKLFKSSRRLNELPITIAQISFDKKSQVEDHALMIGDAAGMITPLCGNGMSMALHAGKMAAHQVHLFLSGKISRDLMEQQYSSQWQKEFANRVRTGRMIQRIFNKPFLAAVLIRLGKAFPSWLNYLVGKTHGKPF